MRELIQSDKRKLTIVFDIDDTLAAHSSIEDEDCIKDKEYYAKGLTFLRTVKPNICFVSHEDYVGTLDSPATEQEQQIIDDSKSRKTNREDCCVM